MYNTPYYQDKQYQYQRLSQGMSFDTGDLISNLLILFEHQKTPGRSPGGKFCLSGIQRI